MLGECTRGGAFRKLQAEIDPDHVFMSDEARG